MAIKSDLPKLVLVEWRDAVSHQFGGWNSVPDVLAIGCPKIVSVGFVINETDEQITIAASMDVEDGLNGTIGGDMTLWKGMITKITELTHGKQKRCVRRQARRAAQ